MVRPRECVGYGSHKRGLWGVRGVGGGVLLRQFGVFVSLVCRAPVSDPSLFLQSARAIKMSAADRQQCLWCLVSLLVGTGAGRECVSGGRVLPMVGFLRGAAGYRSVGSAEPCTVPRVVSRQCIATMRLCTATQRGLSGVSSITDIQE